MLWDIYDFEDTNAHLSNDFEDTNAHLSKIIGILGTSSVYSPRLLNFWAQNPYVLFLNTGYPLFPADYV
jgi:hypothetical protein